MSKKKVQITEYGIITRGDKGNGYAYLDEEQFDKLETFLLENNSKGDNPIEIMTISARKDVGKIIVAKNFVGMIAMKDGTNIEILPKVYSSDGSSMSIERAKKLLIDMIRALRTTTYKSVQIASVDITKMDIFEIFIRMFIGEVSDIVKRGIKCDYESRTENENFFKGKMDFARDIKYNYVHKERNFVKYDEYSPNRVENRLIKATLEYLYKATSSNVNKNDIRRLLTYFDGVDSSVNYDNDFAAIVKDRKMQDYSNALMWSRVFLQGKSFTSFAGNEFAFALLFPMEKLFESYIAKVIRRVIWHEYSVSTQDRTFSLYDKPGAFALRPDIVIKDASATYVMDTKWKILEKSQVHYGISQADMYQMYAYQKKYNAKNVTLLYPLSDKVDKATPISYESADGVIVNVKFVDLFHVDDSVREILDSIL